MRPTMALEIGSSFGGYRIVAPLGAGGMGEVYRARDLRLQRDVALKVLPPSFVQDADRVARFEREARLLASLNCPNIAAIYAIEQSEEGAGLILELIEGPTLADRLRSARLPVAEVLSIARQIVDALDAAHERGIVHRDLKPANIMVTPDGLVKVLDFGLAKGSDETSGADLAQSPTITSAGTRAGVILGTAAYMSPEQARGRAVDRRTDIWAFGCVLYEMLSGRRAFTGETLSDIIAAILGREVDWSALPADAPTSIKRLLPRLLEKDHRRRLRDIADARADLESSNQPSASPVRKQRPRTIYVAVGALAALGITALALVLSPRFDPTASQRSDLGPTFRPITLDASYSTEPALSPDGTLVVYASDRAGEGQLDLWLQRVDGGQPIRLTSDPADDREPSFAPDGRSIVFRSNRGSGGVYVMPALGGDARLVVEGGRGPRFSPDGTRLLYWRGPWLAGPHSGPSSLFVVPSIGGASVAVAEDFTYARNAVWSFDGRGLIFFGGRRPAGGAAELDWWWTTLDKTAPVATGVYALLKARGLSGTFENNTPIPELDALPSSWTRDGVIFSAQLEGSANLWRVAIDEGTGHVEGDSLVRLTSGVGSDVNGSADASGRVAFQVEEANNVSLTLPLDPFTGKALAAPIRQTTDLMMAGGRNSMDATGRLMAYPRHNGNQSEIWLKDLTTGTERPVITTPLGQLNPVLSPNGRQVGYTLLEQGRGTGYVVGVGGGTPRRICVGCNLQGWLSDNRRILIVSRDPNRIRVVDVVDATATDALIATSGTIGRVDITRDGRWYAFVTEGHIWIAPVRAPKATDRSEWIRTLAQVPNASDRSCGWSPDGRLLYMLLERDGFRDLYALRVDPATGRASGEPFVVQHIHDPRRRWGSTPYGTAIADNAFVFHQTEMTGRLWLLTPGAARTTN